MLANLALMLEEGATGITSIITSSDFNAISTNITDVAKIAVPAGMGIMALVVGINMVPKLIKKFTKG